MMKKILIFAIMLFVVLTNISDCIVGKDTFKSDEISKKELIRNYFQPKDVLNSYFPDMKLKKGDLIFCDIKPFFAKFMSGFNVPGQSNDHVAMYIGQRKVIHSAPFGGVRITPLWFFNLWATNITYGRVINSSSKIRSEAIKFAKSQSLKRYQYDYRWPANSNPLDKTDQYSKYWSCAELIWAAYFNSGIDITNQCYTRASGYHLVTTHYLLSADDILLSNNIPPFADMSVLLNKYEDSKIVDFSAWLSFDADAKIKSEYDVGLIYRWDFKNNGTWTEWNKSCNASFTYEKLGEYDVKLQVKDGNCAIHEKIQSFMIYNNSVPTYEKPIIGPMNCKVEEKCNYQINVSDSDGDNIEVLVYFNDGEDAQIFYPVKSGSIITVRHRWQFAGELKLWIRLSDKYSYSEWYSCTINVSND